MIDSDELRQIRREMEDFEEKRESLIINSRNIIHLSKQIIHLCQRGRAQEAYDLVEEIKAKVVSMPEEDFDTGIAGVALQEFVEAVAFFEFIKSRRLITKRELMEFGVENSNYLLGVCDFTGELVRYAVNQAVNKNFEESLHIKEFVAEIYGEFLKMKFRNGELRKKFDSIRWNLKKLEDLAFNISMQNRA